MELPSSEMVYFIQQPRAKTVETLLVKRVKRRFTCNDQVLILITFLLEFAIKR